MDFSLRVGGRTRNGLALHVTFKNKIQLAMRLPSRWKVSCFSIGHPAW